MRLYSRKEGDLPSRKTQFFSAAYDAFAPTLSPHLHLRGIRCIIFSAWFWDLQREYCENDAKADVERWLSPAESARLESG
jgi:hypothetical protein